MFYPTCGFLWETRRFCAERKATSAGYHQLNPKPVNKRFVPRTNKRLVENTSLNIRPGTKFLANRSFSLSKSVFPFGKSRTIVRLLDVADYSAAKYLSPNCPFGISAKTRAKGKEGGEEERVRSRLSRNSGRYSWITIEKSANKSFALIAPRKLRTVAVRRLWRNRLTNRYKFI